MKAKLLIPVFFLMLFGCNKIEDKIEELPDNLTFLKPLEDLTDSLKVLFPEFKNISLSNPEFFSDANFKKIVLTKESKVFVTFINEETESLNSLCWYSYNNSHPPSKLSDIKKNVLFPNISKKDDGGLLESGYTLQLGSGKFPAGTVIGFALIIDGWENGFINYDKKTHYTDYSFNAGGEQQHILFKKSYFDYIILGFEDTSVSSEYCDNDFNDILFAITDNNEGYEASAFDLSNVLVK